MHKCKVRDILIATLTWSHETVFQLSVLKQFACKLSQKVWAKVCSGNWKASDFLYNQRRVVHVGTQKTQDKKEWKKNGRANGFFFAPRFWAQLIRKLLLHDWYEKTVEHQCKSETCIVGATMTGMTHDITEWDSMSSMCREGANKGISLIPVSVAYTHM